MRVILILLSISFFSSCQNFPKVDLLERCVISIEHQKCRCHTYEISENKIGRIDESFDFPIEECENLIGFRTNSWVDLRVWFEEIYLWLEDMKATDDI